MASRSPSGERDPDDLRSFLSGFGYVSRRLWTHTQDSMEAKVASLCSQLDTAPTIPISSLKDHRLASKGELVLLQDAVVRPLESTCLYTKKRKEVVVLKTTEYTDQPKEFEDVFKGTRHESVSRVPFSLWPPYKFLGSNHDKFIVAVKNADLDQLPLEHETSVAPLNPPVTLTCKVTRMPEKVEETKSPSDDVETTSVSVIHVNKVTTQSFLRWGQRLENVFGRLSTRDDGMAEIEPCSMFPKKCFTMSRSEIKREIHAEAKADAFPMRACSFGVGLVSLGLLLSGLYPYV